MDDKIELDDFETLIPSLVGVLDEHNIDKEKHYSIIGSMLFHFSYFLDQYQESYLHEEVSCYVDDNEELISGILNEIYMLGELQIVFGNKKKFTTNIMNIDLENENNLLNNLIGVLRLQEIGEHLNKDEIQEKFIELVANKRNGIHSVCFRHIGDGNKDSWSEYNCQELSYKCDHDLDETTKNIFHLAKRFFL